MLSEICRRQKRHGINPCCWVHANKENHLRDVNPPIRGAGFLTKPFQTSNACSVLLALLWRQDVAMAVPRWPPSSAISHILPSAQQFCPATSLLRLMPKTAGGLLHAGREEEAEAATVDPNGSKCALVPFNHL